MGRGHVEQLPSGRFRVVVYAGKDPITGKKVYLKETHPDEVAAGKAQRRLPAQVSPALTPWWRVP
jgi:integrase